MDMTRRWNAMTYRYDIIGFVVKVQCPQREMLELLGLWQRERGGTLRRLDLSFDWTSDRLTFAQLTDWIRQHLIMRNRAAGIMNTFENGSVYYVPNAHTSERSLDNLLYFDRVSKRDWSGPPVHKNELRGLGAENIERIYGIAFADEIPAINPAAVFRGCFDVSQTFVSSKVAKAVQAAIRKTLRAEHQRHMTQNTKPSARRERYRAMLAKRATRIWANRDLEYVQRVKDIFPRLLIPSNEEIRLPNRLSWDATGRRAQRHV
ncbi:hypothetical protein [Afipia clevelandensis]|nr:hypothetical protein [Afipia clevelandensis]